LTITYELNAGWGALNETYSDFYFLSGDSFITMNTDNLQKGAADLSLERGWELNASEISIFSLGINVSYGSA
jgi:hypothetical protein